MKQLDSAKIIAILPAYNAANTLIDFLKKLPDLFDEIILVDDCSSDNTYVIAKKQKGIAVYRTPQNLGYGGNLKTCLSLALEKGGDIIVELHPDNEYSTDGIAPSLKEIKKGARLVLGNRFSHQSIRSGMFFWKYVSTRMLTFIHNLILQTNIQDLHQGFRVYTRELLNEVNFRRNSNNYIFSFEIILQAVFKKIKIESVPVSTSYTGKKRGASFKASTVYVLGTFRVVLMFLLSQLGFRLSLFGSSKETAICPNCNSYFLVEKIRAVGKRSVFFCKDCMNGFTWPHPQDLSNDYPRNYWVVSGFSGFLKKIVFGFFQKRRIRWLKRYLDKGEILDVGSGSSTFGKSLDDNYNVTNLEAPFAKIESKNMIKTDFLKWNAAKKFDAVVFWESLEHVPYPQKYLQKAFGLLKKDGFIFVEYPRFNCLEAKIFGNNWFHLDTPRHLSHLTDAGIRIIARHLGLNVVDHKGVLALEYAPYGFLASVFNIKREFGIAYALILPPFFVLSFIIEVIFFLVGESPIGYLVAKKTNEN